MEQEMEKEMVQNVERLTTRGYGDAIIQRVRTALRCETLDDLRQVTCVIHNIFRIYHDKERDVYYAPTGVWLQSGGTLTWLCDATPVMHRYHHWFLHPSTVCCSCGCQMIDEHDLVDGLCPECALGSGYEECELCGQIIPLEDVRITDDYDTLCDICYSRAYTVCSECGCDVQRSDIVQTREGQVCPSCASDYYIVCEECGECVRRTDATCDSRSEYYYCDECYDDRSVIQSYGHTDASLFFTEDGIGEREHTYDNRLDNLYFGVELEMEGGDSAERCASEIIEELGADWVEAKHDSSLYDQGVEMVTQPSRAGLYLDTTKIDRLCEIARTHDMHSHDGGHCGLHVHASRKGLGSTPEQRDFTISKILILVYKFWESHLVPFSRRSAEALESWARPPHTDPEDVPDLNRDINNKTLISKNDGTRYMAVNLYPYETIEFRLFRGSLVPETVKASIALCRNIINVAFESSVKDIVNLEWKDIIEYEHNDDLTSYNRRRESRYGTPVNLSVE